MIEIPHYKTLHIEHIVCDYNGTIAKDGMVHPEVKVLFETLSRHYILHVITADTFSSFATQPPESPVTIKVLQRDDHTQEKADYIKTLGAEHCAALGNGIMMPPCLKPPCLALPFWVKRVALKRH